MNFAQNIKSTYKLGVFVAIILTLFFINIPRFDAQQTFWSMQEKIPQYEIYNNELPPYLVADKDHKVHAFNSQFMGEQDLSDSPKAVFYRQWTLSSGWTYPNDIIVDIGGSIDLVGVSEDESGKVHLVYQKNFQDLYYTQAYLANASDPNSWSPPKKIGEQSLHVSFGIPSVAAISNDADGKNIIVNYSGKEYGNGLYFTYSTDYGSNWSRPYPLYLAGDATLVVVSPYLYMGRSGILHAVWSTFDNNGFGGPGYYSKFNLDTNTWSEPMELDRPGIRTPSVIEYKGDVFIAYYHHSTNSRWWRSSNDGGESWTDPNPLLLNHIGTNGGVSFVVDSNDTLHAFLGGRVRPNDMHGLWHSIWLGTSWSSVEAVVSGTAIVDVSGGNGFDPTFARAIVSNGNVILATWGTDGGVGTNGAWYSYITLDAPELPVTPLPKPPAIEKDPMIMSTESITEGVASPTDVSRDLWDKKNTNIVNPQLPILIGVVPAVILIFVIVIRTIYVRRK